jgi:hypothetical protein
MQYLIAGETPLGYATVSYNHPITFPRSGFACSRFHPVTVNKKHQINPAKSLLARRSFNEAGSKNKN